MQKGCAAALEQLPQILYQDRRIVVCVKPAGVLSTDEPGGMPELLRCALGEENGCVRVVHRLDRPVGGVMVYARSRAADAILSQQAASGQLQKTYLAVVHGAPPQQAELQDYLVRDRLQRRTRVAQAPEKDAQLARLYFRRVAVCGEMSLLRIRLLTGRTHQIRTQLSHRAWPIYGDGKYGAPEQTQALALFSCALELSHPQSGERLRFACNPPAIFPWSLFDACAFQENSL